MNTTFRYEYFGDMSRIDRLSSPDITDRGYTITAEFSIVPGSEPEGIILAWGSLFGGFVLYLKDGRVCYEYVYSESVKYALSSALRPPIAKAVIRLKFERIAKNAGRAILIIGNSEVGAVDIPRTWPTHGTTAGLNCGQDAGAPVSHSYERPFRFTGQSLRVVVELCRDSESEPGAAYNTALHEQ